MKETRLKICGITRQQDLADAVSAGADAIGLVFYPPSKRNVSIEHAALLAAQLPPFISCVGLFVDADKASIEAVLEQLPLTLLQFHGNETAAYCESFNRPYIKALRIGGGSQPTGKDGLLQQIAEHSQAQGFLLDSYHPQQAGGTGKTFDWTQIPAELDRPMILAGGLNPDNVEQAIQQVQPYAVDVSSGVEVAPGIKSAELISAFAAAVKGAKNRKSES